jgi:hypothetical protein
MRSLAALASLAILTWGQAFAEPILSLSPRPERIFPPASVLVDVNISGLRSSGLSAPLGAFAVQIRFNSSVFDKNHIVISWGDALGEVGLGDAIAQDSLGDPAGVIASLNLQEVSLLSNEQLSALQSEDFTLATVGFFAPNAVAQNAETFLTAPASEIILSDGNGEQIAYSASSAFATIRLRKVAEPATNALLVLGLIHLTRLYRRKKPTHPRPASAAPAPD